MTEWMPVLADGAAIAAALFAAYGLLVAAKSARQQATAQDLATLVDLTEALRVAEQRIYDGDNDQQNREMINYLNLLEVHAGALNRGVFGEMTKEFSFDRMVSELGMFSAYAPELFGRGVTSLTTFKETAQFYERNREAVDAAAEARRRLRKS